MIRYTVVVLAGCNSILGLGDVRARQEDAKVFLDAPTCTRPSSNFDSFDETVGVPCDTWGYNSNDMCTTTVANSKLVMVSDPDVTTQATRCGCGGLTSLVFTPSSGAFAEVSAVGTGPLEYTQFRAFWQDTSSSSSAIAYGGGMLIFSRDGMTFGMVPYDASSRWWRMRPTDALDGVAGEVSPDGLHWTRFGLDPNPPPAEVKIEFITGTFVIPNMPGEAMPSTVTVEGIDVCP